MGPRLPTSGSNPPVSRPRRQVLITRRVPSDRPEPDPPAAGHAAAACAHKPPATNYTLRCSGTDTCAADCRTRRSPPHLPVGRRRTSRPGGPTWPRPRQRTGDPHAQNYVYVIARASAGLAQSGSVASGTVLAPLRVATAIAVLLPLPPVLSRPSEPPDKTEAWLGSEWTRCELEELRSPNACPIPGGTGRRILADVACKDLEWLGCAAGGGLGCSTTCTCLSDPKRPTTGTLGHGVCPGDIVCREGYRLLGSHGHVAILETPKGSKNCWRAKTAKVRRGRTAR
jgi:hypothetical protein